MYKKIVFIAILILFTSGLLLFLSPTPVMAALGDGWWSTKGTKIVDELGNEVRISGTQWSLNVSKAATDNATFYGINNDKNSPYYKDVVKAIQKAGFNTVRFQVGPMHFDSQNCVYKKKPVQNAELLGLTCLELVDKFVAEAGNQGLKVIFVYGYGAVSINPNNDKDLKKNWETLARRYRANRTVIGADLYNEPILICWGCRVRSKDWRLLASELGQAILRINPNWLIIVEVAKGNDLRPVTELPLQFSKKLVYSVHHYFDHGTKTVDQWSAIVERQWGFVVGENIAPVLVGEFGTINTSATQVAWYKYMTEYFKRNGISAIECCWSYNDPKYANQPWYIMTMINADYLTMHSDDRTRYRNAWFAPQFQKVLFLPTPTPGSSVTPTLVTTNTPTPTFPPGQSPTPTSAVTHTPTPSPTPTSVLGDTNGDRVVNAEDFTVWKTNYLLNQPVEANKATKGNFNNDTKVNGLDYAVWFSQYNR